VSQPVNELPANEVFDVIVIGAGVVGCAMARRFTLEGAKTLVIEKCPDILEGASKGNSAILHTGFDAPPGSLEHQCVQSGYREFMNIREQLDLPVLQTGALVVAWTDEQNGSLQGIADKARENGVEDIQMLTAQRIREHEPELAVHVKAGVSVPGEFVIDPWTTPYVYLLQALSNGARLVRNTRVTGGEFDGQQWRLETSGGSVRGKTVINCAGLYGDELDQALRGRAEFEIRPRKGQFLVYDKAASSLFKSIILPVPSEKTKGVVITRTIFGNVLVGPTAEDQDSRDDASVDSDILRGLQQTAEEMMPRLASYPVTATYAGIRPATQHKDYCIRFDPASNYISVGGIRSTGLTAALGIAGHVFDRYNQHSPPLSPLANITWPRVNTLAQDGKRDWMKPGNSGIVCHCELVTRREIHQALSGPLAAASLGALKRRTRVTMGRCQGFYCSAELGRLTSGCFEDPIGVDHD